MNYKSTEKLNNYSQKYRQKYYDLTPEDIAGGAEQIKIEFKEKEQKNEKRRENFKL